jgi:hypothetical protein
MVLTITCCCDQLVVCLQVRKLVLSTGLSSTFAGTGTADSTGDNAAATAATLSAPSAVAVAANGDVYILDRCGRTGCIMGEANNCMFGDGSALT